MTVVPNLATVREMRRTHLVLEDCESDALWTAAEVGACLAEHDPEHFQAIMILLARAPAQPKREEACPKEPEPVDPRQMSLIAPDDSDR